MDYLITQDLSVCTDCLMVLANGEAESVDTWHVNDEYDADSVEAIDAHAAAIERGWKGWDVTIGSITCEHCVDSDDGDCEPWFSHSRCDLCDNPRGGSRVHATAHPETYVALVGARDWNGTEDYSAETIERKVMNQVNRLNSLFASTQRERDALERTVEILDETIDDIATDLRYHVDNPAKFDERETLQDIARRLLQLKENDASRGADIEVPDVAPILTQLSPAQQAIYALTGKL